MPGLPMNLREQLAELLEQTADKKEKNTEDTSRERRVEIQLRATGQRGPQDNDIRQSARIPELQNRDLWLRPTDMF